MIRADQKNIPGALFPGNKTRCGESDHALRHESGVLRPDHCDGTANCQGTRRNAMKWYYQWKLKKILKEINKLRATFDSPLIDNYTANARLRSLTRVAQHLQQRLEESSAPSLQH
jgi:hypothetical protein